MTFTIRFQQSDLLVTMIWFASDTFISKIDRFISKFGRKWSKTNVFCHFGHHFWYKSTFNWLLRSFNQTFRSFNQTFRSLNWSFNGNRSNLYWKRSNFNQNCNRWFGFVVGFFVEFLIGPKMTIEIDWLETRIVDDSICKP